MHETFTVGTVLIALFTAVTIILRSAAETLRRNRSEKLRAEIYSKMIDKFGTSQDMVTYLESGAGQDFLKSAPVEKPYAYTRILNSLQGGSVLTVLGSAILLVRNGVDRDANEPLLVIGSLILALGIGLLISSGIAYFLSRSWGLINGAQRESQ
jgi:hypothetical protein